MDDLEGLFRVKCSDPECQAERDLALDLGMGLYIGCPVPTSTSDPRQGRCFRCSRYSLVITATPSTRS